MLDFRTGHCNTLSGSYGCSRKPGHSHRHLRAHGNEMIDIIVKILVEVLSILGMAEKEMKQGRTSK